MPHLMPTPCRYPGCPALSHDRYCDAHARATRREYDARRGSGAERGYGAPWRQLRATILRRDPVCRWPGCEERSTDVDHIVSKRRGGSDDPSNLRGLCHSHHSRKTVIEDNGWGVRARQ